MEYGCVLWFFSDVFCTEWVDQEAASINFVDISPCNEFPCTLYAGNISHLTIGFATGNTPESKRNIISRAS